MSQCVSTFGDMRNDAAWNAVVELAASRHGTFHASEAATAGIEQRRLRLAVKQGELLRPYPRVYVLRSAQPSPLQRLHVATLATQLDRVDGATTSGVLSHASASALHGLIPNHPPIPSLWVPRGHRVRAEGIDVRRSEIVDPSIDITAVHGLPVMSRAAALCQLGWVAPHLVERAVDEFARTSSMRWLSETADRYRSQGSRGVVVLDQVLNDPKRLVGVTESWFERVVAGVLRHRDLPPIELQYEVIINGRRYRIDIAIPEARVGVEAHSREFQWGPRTVDADNVRDLLFGSVGWQLFYVTWWQAHHPEAFADLLTSSVRSRLASGVVTH